MVRATASDVRRRLAQHYSGSALLAEFRISLPPGGYVPEIDRVLPSETPSAASKVEQLLVEAEEPQPTTVSVASVPQLPETTVPIPPVLDRSRQPLWRMVVFGVLTLTLLIGAVAWSVAHRQEEEERLSEPWEELFHSGEAVPVIVSDPDLNEIQLLTKHYVPLSDYAKSKLGCDTLAPELQRVCTEALRGDKVAEVDASALVYIARGGTLFHSHLEAHAARSMRLQDLQSNRNFVLLGSKVANPWADLYRSRTDSYIDHDPATGLQVVYDQHHRPGEPVTYVPSAGPYGTGEELRAYHLCSKPERQWVCATPGWMHA